MSLRRQIKPRNSLAFRLTIWYAGIFAVTSCIAFLLFYARITTLIRDQTDQELLGQRNRFAILLGSEGPDAVKNSAIIEAQAAGVRKVFFRFLSMDGQVFSSSNMSYWKDIDIDVAAVKTLLGNRRPLFQTISMAARKEQVRVLYAFLGPSVILQVGIVMESYSHFLDAFQGIFILTMTLLIVLAAGIGWFLARRAVSGVESVTRTAQKISGGTLDQRVPVQKRGDEIDQLAITFNRMLDRIQALLKEIKEMSDNIAHDMRSPIARIRGVAEVTLTNSKALSEYESMAASTIEECDRLLDMINTMLLISKAESGVAQIAHEQVDLSEIVRRACELFEPTAEDKNIALDCTVTHETYLVGDTPMLQRMLSNLIDNAIKYTHADGAVHVEVSENSSRAIIVVRDTGIGISAAEVPRIFERFYRCDQSRSQTGIGLGLSLSQAIAHAHGGDITVNSAPGQGSTFTVVLPKSFSPQAATQQ